MAANSIGWFEIPVTDMERARKFYETVFKVQLQVQSFNDLLMGWFPFEEGKPGASGSLVHYPEFYEPSEKAGVLVYFSSEDVSKELGRVEEAGGSVLQSKTLITEDVGYMGVFLDSEGNRIALHSRH